MSRADVEWAVTGEAHAVGESQEGTRGLTFDAMMESSSCYRCGPLDTVVRKIVRGGIQSDLP